MNKWISVKDELPKFGELVLAISGNIYYLDSIVEMPNCPEGYFWNENWIDSTITHWMPLPESPNE